MTRNLEKLLKNEPEFFLPENLTKLTQEKLTSDIFSNKTNFALLDERTRLLQQLGKVIN